MSTRRGWYRLNDLFPWKGLRFRIHGLFWFVIFSSVVTGHFIEVTTLFVLVFIHELGHITVARSFGWRMTEIELLPFGGVARTDEWGTVPAREEIAVALAGPFHNVMMVLFGYLFCAWGWWSQAWMEYFIQGNALMAGFNPSSTLSPGWWKNFASPAQLSSSLSEIAGMEFGSRNVGRGVLFSLQPFGEGMGSKSIHDLRFFDILKCTGL